MNEVKEAISQLESLRLDRESFLDGISDEKIYKADIEAINIAIQALEEKLERDKGCEYCQKEKCVSCVKFYDYYGDGGSNRCISEMSNESCVYFKPVNSVQCAEESW